MNLNQNQIKLIKDSWEKVSPIADQAADLFYGHLFEIAPTARSMFPTEMAEQKKKLMTTLGFVVASLNNIEEVVPQIQDLGRRHIGYGTKAEHFPVVGEALLWTLEQGLGESWNQELADAWTQAYTLIAQTMKDAMMSNHNQENNQFSEERAILDALSQSQAVIEFEPDGTIITANSNFLNALDYSLNEIVGQHHKIFCDAAYTASTEYSKFWADLAAGNSFAGKFERFTKTGKSIWIEASYNPISGTDGKVYKVIKYATDITQAVKDKANADRIQSMVENAPVNIIMADLDLNITYMNPASFNTLKTLQKHLPIDVSNIIGQSVDIFHRDPSYQRNILSNPNNLPHSAEIKVGNEVLDLLVSPIRDENGTYLGPMVTWSVITKELETKHKADRIQSMVENAPINIMMTDLDLNVTYLNPESEKTLRSIEHLLAIPVDKILGSNIDIFHKNPSYQRELLANPNNLPHNAKIKLGDETLDLLVTAIRDEDGNYIGPMVTWSVVTAQLNLVDNLRETAQTLAAAAAELTSASGEMAAASEETSSQAENVASATEQVDQNARTVAAAVEQMSSSISEIAKNVTDQRGVTEQAVEMSLNTTETMSKLGDSSEQIGKVVKMITTIAQQTNLLALNATIEAARAGEAGKGFAVVANEVKELAKQTAKATDEISGQIESIQSDTKDSVKAIEGISSIINQISEISGTVASATEEQSSTTTEISRNIQQVAGGTQDISRNITSVAEASRTNGSIATNLQTSAEDLSQLASKLQELVDSVKI